MPDGMEASFCSCDYDYDPPEFFIFREKKARKVHRCCECGAEIQIGEQYERIAGKWDGEISVFKTCLTCSRIRVDYCAPFTMLRVTLFEGLGCDYLGEWGKEEA